MKNKKCIFLSVLAATAVFSQCLSVNAYSKYDAGNLKRYLVLNNTNSGYQYNTNNDNTVNVLDMCRMKRDLVEPVIDAEPVKFTFDPVDYPNDEENTVYVPLVINKGTYGVSTVQITLDYPEEYFTVNEVLVGDFDGDWAISRNGKEIQYIENQAHNIEKSGIIGYIKLEAKLGIPSGKYYLNAGNIRAATLPDGKIQRMLDNSECNERIDNAAVINTRYINFTKVTEMTTTTVTTTTTPEPTTTTVTTTTTPEPTTTTVTTTTTPEPTTTTVTTTTTPEPTTTTVTTTTTPEPTTTTVTTTTTPEPTTTTIITTVSEAGITGADVNDADKQMIVDAINQKRVSSGYSVLSYNYNLAAAADARAAELAGCYQFERPDGSDYDTIFEEHGYPNKYSSYQLVSRNKGAAAMASTAAGKEGILDSDYTTVGIGRYGSGSSSYWVVFLTN